MFKAVLFDMDDTLIQTKVAKYGAHKHTAKHFYNRVLEDSDIDFGVLFNNDGRSISVE
jgi:beta-phosphoglucomutase-like phosphatase (HAD superfamily)